jgi:hypothetical protein
MSDQINMAVVYKLTAGLGVTPSLVLRTFKATLNLFQLPSKTCALIRIEMIRRRHSHPTYGPHTSHLSQFLIRIRHRRMLSSSFRPVPAVRWSCIDIGRCEKRSGAPCPQLVVGQNFAEVKPSLPLGCGAEHLALPAIL